MFFNSNVRSAPLGRAQHLTDNASIQNVHSEYIGLSSKMANDGCGVRTHALSDWRLKPAP